MGYFWLTYLFVTVSIVLFPLASTLATGTNNKNIFLFTFLTCLTADLSGPLYDIKPTSAFLCIALDACLLNL